jgi:UPF0755 protein
VRRLLKLIFILIVAFALWLAWGLLLPVNPGQTKFVMLKPGWSTRHIANELQASGVIHSARALLLYHYVMKPRTLKAGEYKFDDTASALAIHDRLTRGDVYVHSVTVPEGFNMFEIGEAIEAAGLGKQQEFVDQAKSQFALIKDLDPEAKSLEGYLFPDTYGFTRTQTMQDIIAIMVRRFKQEARAIGLTTDVHRVVTLAAIVEKETAAASERPVVAGVYLNRLQKGMALDADPSVIYAARLAGRYQGTIYQSDLQFDSPYNTYKHPGLPPGPIANPGRASLEAAMHPTSTDFLFFVSDNNGHHRFARTMDEHSHNVALYRHAVAASAAR